MFECSLKRCALFTSVTAGSALEHCIANVITAKSITQIFSRIHLKYDCDIIYTSCSISFTADIFFSAHSSLQRLNQYKNYPLKTISEPVFRSFFRTSAPMKVRDFNLGLIIGIIIAVLVALAVVVCFVTLYRRWKVSLWVSTVFYKIYKVCSNYTMEYVDNNSYIF